jgi:hypothetical protein
MNIDENATENEKRRQQVYADEDDILVRVLGIREADYECVRVNSSWPEKGLIEGDLILIGEGGGTAAGDIVMIEEEGQTRLGLASDPGFLETAYGRRPLEASEHIVGIGAVLVRKLSKQSQSSF